MSILSAMTMAQLQTTRHLLQEMRGDGVGDIDTAISAISAEIDRKHTDYVQSISPQPPQPPQPSPQPSPLQCPKCGAVWAEVNGQQAQAYVEGVRVDEYVDGVRVDDLVINTCRSCRWSEMVGGSR